MELRPILSTLLRQRTGPLLVALQVAISLAILANALFVVQQRLAVAQRPSGIADEQDVGYVFVRPLQVRSHNEALAGQQRELAALRAIPGVVSVAWTSQMPMSRSGSSSSVRVRPGQPQETAQPSVYLAHGGFVSTLGLELVEGRDFNAGDLAENDPVTMGRDQGNPTTAIITRELGKVAFPDATSYLGKVLYFGMDDKRPVRVVGVVEALQTNQAQASIAGERSVILPMSISLQFSRYAIRAEAGQLDKALAAATEALRKSAPSAIRVFTRTVSEDRANRYRNEKALAWMLIAISVLLLLVTVSGIVGMTSLRVAQRRKQIGVRRALGARWRDILRYFIMENLLITSGGVAAGLLLALALNRLLMAQLGLPRLPLEYLALGAAALWVLGIAAVYGPASRAASISPAIATRTA